ncbi:MAG TPA: segregation/condensation protein A [Solirubrobacteraceae bacterium]|jgi:segregation and condensation protein A|nr:segregation/condensation protein A [Solirubrobacteraceae bacterium]
MLLAELELDLEIFSGPFDLLLTLVLRDVVDLLELQLAEVVVTYLDHLQARGELDLEAATEFIVLVAALLELKSRLMLAGDDDELFEFEPGEAAEELLARMLEARRYRGAAQYLEDRLADEPEVRYRQAPLPVNLRRRSLEDVDRAIWNPASLGRALGGLLAMPAKLDLRHIGTARVTVGERLAHLRGLLRRASAVDFDEAVRGADRVTVAMTVFALLELYKQGEANWTQDEPFSQITIRPAAGRTADGG